MKEDPNLAITKDGFLCTGDSASSIPMDTVITGRFKRSSTARFG